MATIFTDNFDSYTPGNLSGQGGWTTYGYSTQKVGAGGITNQATYNENNNNEAQSNVYKDGTSLLDGRITFHINTHRLPPGTEYLMVGIYAPGSASICCKIWLYDNGIYAEETQILAIPVVDTWYCIEMEWRSSDYKFRARVDGGTWSAWIAGAGGNWTAGLGRVWIGSYKFSTDKWYVDSFSEFPLWKHKFIGVGPPNLAKAIGIPIAEIGKIIGI
jgi:hypothetical protein